MARRPVVTIHLPLEMGSVGRILKTVAYEYPDATVSRSSQSDGYVIIAEADPLLTRGARRRLARDRQRAARAGEQVEP